MGAPSLTAAELQALLEEKDPSVILAPGQILRRVIRHDRGSLGLQLQVPHKKSYLLDGEALLRLTTPEELGVGARVLAKTVILLARPSDDKLAETPREKVLLEYWRLLFHARVHAVLEERWAKGELTIRGIQQWIQTVGDTEFREACSVLRSESMLLPPEDLRHGYIEFAAVYLELRHFAGTLLPSYFPALREHEHLAASLEAEVGAARLFHETRLRGAPEPCPPAETTSEEPIAHFRDLSLEAREAEDAGSLVRAAIVRTRASRVAPAAETEPTIARAHEDLDQLVARLLGVIALGRDSEARWREVLRELLDKSDHGYWPSEARLLYDLQNCCIHAERDVYRVSALRWLVGGELKQKLPDQRDLQICKHLSRAIGRLPTVRLSVAHRQELSTLLNDAVRAVEGRIRDRLRPLIEGALVESGLKPASYPEQIVLAKIVDELLDRIAARWFLTFSDIRDAISHNQLKLGDLDSLRTLARGDTLLQIDRRLHASLVGVYRPAESYRSWFQRLSGVFAATGAGRVVVWNLFLPLGGAFVARIGAEHIHDVFASIGKPAPAAGTAPVEEAIPTLAQWAAPLVQIGVLAIFLAILVNSSRARRVALQFLRYLSLCLRGILVELPLALSKIPFVRRLLENDVFVAFVRYVVRPAAITVAFGLAFWSAHNPLHVFPGYLLVFLCSALVLNSRPWRTLVEENLEDSVLRSWRFLAIEAIPGLFRGILLFFKHLSEALEAFLYGVDQWLRFRTGEGRATLVAKAVLGPLWAPVNWCLRFTFDVALEPRINPVKYLSVVMVLDKLELPLSGSLMSFWKGVFSGLGGFGSNVVAVFMLYAIPDMVGFLVWEFKENWRLYRANRSPALETQGLAPGGETLPRLLKGGGHGVGSRLTKLYGKLRHAERQAHKTGSWTDSRKQRAALEEVRRSVRQFADRGFLALLGRSRAFSGVALEARGVLLGLNQVTLELECARSPGKVLLIGFEAQSGWLVASIMAPGFLPDLSPEQAATFKIGLVGLYKMSGVELVKEQVALYLRQFTALGLVFDLTPEGLKVWPKDQFEAAALYDLHEDGTIKPQPIVNPTPLALPSFEASKVLFSETEVSWEEWLEAWAAEEAGTPPRLAERVSFPLLPITPTPVTRRLVRQVLAPPELPEAARALS